MSSCENHADCPVLSETLSLIDSFTKSFDDFDTEHKRIAYLRKLGHYIPPVKCSLTEAKKNIKRTSSGEIKENLRKREAYVHFFPLRTILKKVFELPRVFDTVFAYKKMLENDRSSVTNFIQSNLWKRKIKDCTSDKVLPLFLFSDDYETGNPLSGHSGQNKLAGTYVSIPCFPPQWQSSLSSIFHALLYYSKDRQQFGNFAIFRKLIEEFKFLETQGVELELPQGKTRIFF